MLSTFYQHYTMSHISILPTLLTHRSDQFGKSQIVIRVYHQQKIAAVINIGQKCSEKFLKAQKNKLFYQKLIGSLDR